jgi:hypothetical protein
MGIYVSQVPTYQNSMYRGYKDFISPMIAKDKPLQICVSTFQRENHGTAFIPQKMAKSSTRRVRHGRYAREKPASNVLYQAKTKGTCATNLLTLRKWTIEYSHRAIFDMEGRIWRREIFSERVPGRGAEGQ